MSIGLVKNVPSPKSGGNSKSPGPGAWNSSPSAAWATLTRCKASPFPARCIRCAKAVQNLRWDQDLLYRSHTSQTPAAAPSTMPAATKPRVPSHQSSSQPMPP